MFRDPNMVERENKLPVNQHALEMLRQAGEKPNPRDDLGLPTLMQWALDKGGLAEPRENDWEEFRRGVEALNYSAPAASMKLLLQHPEVDFPEMEFLREKEPLKAAWLSLDHLDSLLFHLSEGYGRPTR